MPENETLKPDTRTANRWRPFRNGNGTTSRFSCGLGWHARNGPPARDREVIESPVLKDRLDHGEPPSDLFPDLEVAIYTCLRRVWKQWRGRGVEPAALFDAAMNNPEALHDLVRRTGFDSYAQLLEDVVAGEPSANLEGLLCSWLNAWWDCVRDQLQLDRHEVGLSNGFADRVNQMLDRLLRLLAEHPSRIPRRPPRPPRDDSRDIDDILDLPLL